MRQFKITSADFRLPDDTGEPDAYLSPEELALIKKEAGIDQLGIMERYLQQSANTPINDSETS